MTTTAFDIKIGDPHAKLWREPRGMHELDYHLTRRGRVKGQTATKHPPLYVRKNGFLRMTVHGGDFYLSTDTSVTIDFAEGLEIKNHDLSGTIYKPFHHLTLSTRPSLPAFSSDEAAMLNLIVKNGIKDEHHQHAAHWLLYTCMVCKPELRQPIATRFPWYWSQQQKFIKRSELRRQFTQVIWTLLATCPDDHFHDDLDVPTAKEAAESSLAQVERQYSYQGGFLREAIRRMRKYAPPMWLRILNATAEAIEKEEEAVHRAELGAQMLDHVKKEARY